MNAIVDPVACDAELLRDLRDGEGFLYSAWMRLPGDLQDSVTQTDNSSRAWQHLRAQRGTNARSGEFLGDGYITAIRASELHDAFFQILSTREFSEGAYNFGNCSPSSRSAVRNSSVISAEGTAGRSCFLRARPRLVAGLEALPPIGT